MEDGTYKTEGVMARVPRINVYVGFSITYNPNHEECGKEICITEWFSPVPFRAMVMPCGERYEFSQETFPREDMPCRCGGADEWAVKFTADPHAGFVCPNGCHEKNEKNEKKEGGNP